MAEGRRVLGAGRGLPERDHTSPEPNLETGRRRKPGPWTPEEKKAYNAAYHAKHRKRLREKSRQDSARRRNAMWELKRGPCMDCGQTFHPVAMDFDHRDPTQKEGCPAIVARTWR